MARSGLTISNQDRLRRYNEERLQEERNDVVQQAELYGYLAEENKLDAQATSLARLAKNVFKKSFDLPKIDEKAIFKEITKAGNTILDSIKAGKLDELVKSIIAIPANQLNARQKIIQKDLGLTDFKQSINDAISEAVLEGKTNEEIKEIVLELVGGSEGKADLEDMAAKARSGSFSSEGSNDSEISSTGTTITLGTDQTSRKPISYKEITRQLKESQNKSVDAIVSLGLDNFIRIEPGIKPNIHTVRSLYKAGMYKKNLIEGEIPKSELKKIEETITKYGL